MGKAAKSFSKDAQKKLLEHAWPGNVRELRNAVERAVVIESGSQISAKNLPIAQMSQPTVSPINDDFWDSLPQDFDSACSVFQEKLLHRTLEAHKGNASAASRSLGIARSTLYRYLGKFEEK